MCCFDLPIRRTERVANDGTVTLHLPPELAGRDVEITVGDPARVDAPARPTLTPEQWRAVVDRVAGSAPDFPDVERPGPNAYERREPLD